MDPAPGGRVEIEDVVLRHDVEVVIRYRGDPRDGLEYADDEHQDTGEDRAPGGPAGRFGFVLRHAMLLPVRNDAMKPRGHRRSRREKPS